MNQRGLLEWKDLARGLLHLGRRVKPIFQTARILATHNHETRMSLGAALARSARRYPHHIAVKHEGDPVTYRELDAWSNRLAHHFIAAGLRPGQAVAVLVDNRPSLLAVVAAVTKAGGVAGMINTNQRKGVLVHSFRACEPTMYAVGEELIAAFEEARPELGDIAERSLLWVRDRGQSPAPPGYTDLDHAARAQPESLPRTTEDIRLSAPCFYIFTSGTTGLPKASIMSHDRWIKGGYAFGGLCLGLAPGETLYAPLPLYHNQALTLGWSSACIHGAALAIRRKFSASGFWSDCRRHGAGAFVYIGEVPRYLLNQPPASGDRDHPVRKMIGVGLRPDIWRPFKGRFGVEEVYEFYGASELQIVFANALNIDCTVGFCPLSWALVAFDVASGAPLRGADGRMTRVGKGEVGLLIAKVSARFKFEGYTDPAATEDKLFRNVFEDGDVWVNSGDLMRSIGFGHLQFVDRVGDTFRWKSENVSTGEVEGIINALEGIAESTVYGVELPGAVGRAGMAAIAPSGPSVELDALLCHMRAELPGYAIPLFVRITGPLDVTGTFKHDKVALRDQGYDPGATQDPIYVLLPGAAAYQRLTGELHDRIRAGQFAF